jgi:hypothetical protein
MINKEVNPMNMVVYFRCVALSLVMFDKDINVVKIVRSCRHMSGDTDITPSYGRKQNSGVADNIFANGFFIKQ